MSNLSVGEWVVLTFYRTDNGNEEMHCYAGCGRGETGKTRAINKRLEILRLYKDPLWQNKPLPVVKIVEVQV